MACLWTSEQRPTSNRAPGSTAVRRRPSGALRSLGRSRPGWAAVRASGASKSGGPGGASTGWLW